MNRTRIVAALAAALALALVAGTFLLPGPAPAPVADLPAPPPASPRLGQESATPSAPAPQPPQSSSAGTSGKLTKTRTKPEPPATEVSVKVAEKDLARLDRAASKLGYVVVDRMPQIGWAVVRSTKGQSAALLAASLERAGITSAAEPASRVYPMDVPTDPQFSAQWGYRNTGQTGGTPGADSNAVPAWDWSRGDGVIVAVVDTGVDAGHPELTGQMWHNPGETAANGIDDDGNGKIDDTVGWDFAHADGTVFDPADGDQHGTHVAGTIAAETNNGIGVAGMARGAQIMSLKFLTPHSGSDALGAAAIVYAVDNGAQVVNCSWGGGPYTQVLVDAIAYAAQNNVLIVVSAGNSAVDIDTSPTYPASYPATNIVTVASLNHNDGMSSFSNYGDVGVDLGAPGESVYSLQSRLSAGLLVSPPAYKAMYLPYPAESITDAGVRQDVIGRSVQAVEAAPGAPILIVDDSRASVSGEAPTARLSIYQAALAAEGYTDVTTWSTISSGTPSAAAMSGRTVVWFTGAATFGIPAYGMHGTLVSAERTALANFLNGGGRLVISSGDLGYDMLWIGGTALTWYRTYLHASYAGDDPGTNQLYGLAGGPLAGLEPYIDDPKRYSDGYDAIGPYDAYATSVAEWEAYATMSGTSMAAPHVTGALALAIARRPGESATDLKQRLLSTAVPVPALAGNTVTGGRLDAAAVAGTLNAPPLTLSPGGSGVVALSWTNPTDADFAATRVLARSDAEPNGPDDPAATVLSDGTGTSATHSGLTIGQTVHYASYARNNLGSWSEASRVTTVVADPGPGVPIPAGTNVSVTYDGVTLRFSEVYTPGWLSVTRMPPRIAAPANFAWVGNHYFDIHPVGSFATPVDIELAYDPGYTNARADQLHFFHHTGGSWTDATTSVDGEAHIVYARADSFSDFGLGEPEAEAQAALSAEQPWTAPLLVAGVALLVAVARRRARA